MHTKQSFLETKTSSVALFLLSALVLFIGTERRGFGDDSSFDDTNYLAHWEDREKENKWIFSPGLNAGYTDLLHGYPNYKNLGNAGFDIYLRQPLSVDPTWREKLLFRLSGDYVPLQTPEGVRGIVHDVYSVNGSVIYRFFDFENGEEYKQTVPFIGGGVGVYWDRIVQNHPAFPKVTTTQGFLGLNASVGVMLPAMGRLRLVPEIRYHTMRQYKSYWPSYVSYQLALVYWTPTKVVE